MIEHTTEHEEAPVDEAVSGPPADEGNTESVDRSPDHEPNLDEPETFPREYVQKLRDESAKYRQPANGPRRPRPNASTPPW